MDRSVEYAQTSRLAGWHALQYVFTQPTKPTHSSNGLRPAWRCCGRWTVGDPHWGLCGTASTVSRSGGCLVALLGAVDGGASDTEQVGQFGGAVLTGLEQADQMCFLPGIELGLLAAEPTLGLRYLHPFSGAQPDQVGLELRDHATR